MGIKLTKMHKKYLKLIEMLGKKAENWFKIRKKSLKLLKNRYKIAKKVEN